MEKEYDQFRTDVQNLANVITHRAKEMDYPGMVIGLYREDGSARTNYPLAALTLIAVLEASMSAGLSRGYAEDLSALLVDKFEPLDPNMTAQYYFRHLSRATRLDLDGKPGGIPAVNNAVFMVGYSLGLGFECLKTFKQPVEDSARVVEIVLEPLHDKKRTDRDTFERAMGHVYHWMASMYSCARYILPPSLPGQKKFNLVEVPYTAARHARAI